MSTDVKTPYLDLHHRVIYKSARGAYYVKDASGKKYYGVKARYVAVVHGTARKLTTKNAPPPTKIAPKRVAAPPKVRTSTRKVRSNVGVKRKAYKPRVKKVAAMASPASSPSKRNGIHVTRFTFRVDISGDHGDYHVESESDALKVCKWYKDLNSHYEQKYDYRTKKWTRGGDLAEKITYEPMIVSVRRNRFGASYMEKEFHIKVCVYSYDDVKTRGFVDDLKMLIDPDDDGNHPITLNHKKYLVSGHEFKLV